MLYDKDTNKMAKKKLVKDEIDESAALSQHVQINAIAEELKYFSEGIFSRVNDQFIEMERYNKETVAHLGFKIQKSEFMVRRYTRLAMAYLGISCVTMVLTFLVLLFT